MTDAFQIAVDRAARTPIAIQIHGAIRDAIQDGRLGAGARLPSWRDLAAQLGVARGTVQVAYARLIDEQLLVAAGAAGTRVADRIVARPAADRAVERPPLPGLFHDFGAMPLPFQMGVPAQDAFPLKIWSRMMVRGARAAAAAPVSYPDPRGHPDLRREIAAYLALARGISCTPDQILITAGYFGALGLALQALRLQRSVAWLEDPGFPLTRAALGLGGVEVVAVPVDADGIDVAEGIRRAPHAALAVVTPGQQAPLGMKLSLARRLALLEWARASGAWIVEDDYLSELQLEGRAAPALASLDRDGRVLHIGTFSKTISPALRLGFLVAPPPLAALFGDAAACLAPAPSSAVQRTVAEFMAGGHYLRHLRHMKRLYAMRRQMLVKSLQKAMGTPDGIRSVGGLAVRIDVPAGADDQEIATRALSFGLSPVPMTPWYAAPPPVGGLLLCVTNLVERRLDQDCSRLLDLVAQSAATAR